MHDIPLWMAISNFTRIIQLVDSMALDSFCVAIYSNPAVAIDGSSIPAASFLPQLENWHSVLKASFS